MAEDVPLVEVSATLEVLIPPAVDRLYFWALQASFVDRAGHVGAGHLGLQWNARHPGHGAVNWGGYATDGTILSGSPSPLPSARNDRNTRDYMWQPKRPYRFRISRSPDRSAAWRGEVIDIESGDTTTVRDLYGGGDYLAAPIVWSEVFARCEHPSVQVKWNDMHGRGSDGTSYRPRAVKVNYQSQEHGGCANTSVRIDEGGVTQMTNVERSVEQDTLLRLPDSQAG